MVPEGEWGSALSPDCVTCLLGDLDRWFLLFKTRERMRCAQGCTASKRRARTRIQVLWFSFLYRKRASTICCYHFSIQTLDLEQQPQARETTHAFKKGGLPGASNQQSLLTCQVKISSHWVGWVMQADLTALLNQGLPFPPRGSSRLSWWQRKHLLLPAPSVRAGTWGWELKLGV